jgi:hypothetical protein
MVLRRHPFKLIDTRIYSDSHCFYCGKALRKHRTKEHVFPQWLQHKFRLQHQTIVLLNRSSIQYSKLKVPCCKPCNTVHLSQLENRVKRLLFEEPISMARRHSADIFAWACKILLGIVYIERLLPLDRRHPAGQPILPPQLWRSFEMAHFFVQSLRIPIDFSFEGKPRIPGSVFIFNLQSTKEPEAQFDFRDGLLTLSIFMRLGTRGLVVVADGGALDVEIGQLLRREGRYKLHPLQFEELGAICFYKASLLNRTPTFIMFERRGRYQVMQMPLPGLSEKPVFDEWEHPRYAEYLAEFTGYPIEVLAPGDRTKVMQWREDDNGARLKLDIRQTPHLLKRAGPAD